MPEINYPEWLQNSELPTWAEKLIQNPLFWGIVASIIFLGFIIMRLRQNTKSIELFGNKDGSITVSRSALTHLVQRISMECGSVGAPKVRIQTPRGKLKIQTAVRLFADQNVETFSTRLQTRLQQALKDNLGITSVSTINIKIASFAPGESLKSD